MYRCILPILLCMTVHSAPQDSDITYVKIQPLNTDLEPAREPRNDQVSDKQSTIIQNTSIDNQTTIVDITTTLDPISESLNPSIINKLNRISSEDPNRPTKNFSNQTESKTVENPYRFARSDVTNYETTTNVVTETEKNEKPETTQFEVRTRPPLRYLSKLSYYKTTASYGGSEVNLLEKVGKRRFRSKCRCEKIWNCPKLQITVPRCPDEYFLCCF